MMPLHRVIKDFEDTVETVQELNVKERYEFLHLEASVKLVDGTVLHVSEVWMEESLEKYSYYWLDKENQIITGWDNAPHHENVETFPHHKHEQNEIKPSESMNGAKVLKEIQERL